MPARDPTSHDLLREWQKLVDSLIGSITALAGRAELPHQLLEPLQRQLELVQEVVERERELQQELTRRALAPLDATFDLLAESASTLGSQAEALSAAGRALEDTAQLVRRQADLFERAVAALREPAELAKSAAGIRSARPKRRGR